MSQFTLLETLRPYICVRCKLGFASFDSYTLHRRCHVKLYSFHVRKPGECYKSSSAEKLLSRKKCGRRKRLASGIKSSKSKLVRSKARTIREEIQNGDAGDEENVDIAFDSQSLSRRVEKTPRNVQKQRKQTDKNKQSMVLKVKLWDYRKASLSKPIGKVTKRKVKRRTKRTGNVGKISDVKTVGISNGISDDESIDMPNNGISDDESVDTPNNGISDDESVVDALLDEKSVDLPNGDDFEIVDVKFSEIQNETKTGMNFTEEDRSVERTPEGGFRCRVCGKAFKRDVGRKIHEATHALEEPVERTPDGRFKCRKCDKTYASNMGRKTHEATHDGSMRVRCNICLKDFARPTVLALHMKKHTGLDKFKCHVCKKLFNQKIQLTLHMKMHTGEKDFQCQYCKKQFTRKFSWINHEVTVHQSSNLPVSTTIIKCKHCDKIFTSNASLAIHERSHVGEKPYKCKTCGKGFNHKSNLTEHARIHSDVKPYSCDYCGGRFRFLSNLKTHQKMHLGIKKFECKVCGHKFTQKSGLETHLPTHTGEQPYHCPYCKVGAWHTKAMKDHIKLHHSKEKKTKVIASKKLECSECNQTFSHPSMLAQHMTQHSDKFMCRTCNMRFPNNNRLQVHLKGRNHIEIAKNPSPDKHHQCSICKTIFLKSKALQKHMKGHSDDPFKCYICNVNFSNEDKLKRHKTSFAHKQQKNAFSDIAPHTGHQCTTCGKAYPTIAKLAAHRNSHTDKFKCYICLIRFPSEWHLNRHKEKKKHMQTVNPNADMPFACESCDKVYSKAAELEKHMVCHTDKYKCKVCDVGYSFKSKLERHEKSQAHIKRAGQLESDNSDVMSVEDAN